MDTGKTSTFFQVITLMASSFDEQIRVFPPFVVIPDEIALLFDDIYRDTSQMYQDNKLSLDSVNLLTKMNDLLDNMSNDLTKWNIESLKKDADWDTIRSLARSILEIQGIGNEKVNFDFTHWISG
ncbi:MAG TPA: hypothetical protein GXZ56_07125 [Bacteroidales bacterium]|jgi:hypothetical protein|nr:hypothetical protein [Bacteroidales bacterium]